MKNTAQGLVLFLCLAACFPLFGDEREELTRALREELGKYEGHIDVGVVASLLEAGANPNGICDPQRDARIGKPFLARVVETYGGDQRIVQLAQLLLDHGALVDTVNEKGETILWSMVDRRNHDRIDILLRYGADPNKQNTSGETPLMVARSNAVTAALLAHGADPNVRDNDGNTALMNNYAGLSGNNRFINMLLDAGADPTIKNNEGQTVLHRRIYMLSNEALLDDLISRGCFIDEPDFEGYTPLMLAARWYNYDKTVAALLKKGADPNLPGPMGRTALHLYLLTVEDLNDTFYRENNYIPVAATLLAAGARPADKDLMGDSALTSAVRLALRYKEMRPLRDLVSRYASAGAISEAKKAAGKTVGAEKSKRLWETLSTHIPATLLALVFPLAIGGLGILMRKNLVTAHIMGLINALLTLCSIGLLIGFIKGANSHEGSGAWADMFGPFIYGVIGGSIGLVVGGLLALLPPVWIAFARIPVLYYSPAALSVIAAGVYIYNIWRY